MKIALFRSAALLAAVAVIAFLVGLASRQAASANLAHQDTQAQASTSVPF